MPSMVPGRKRVGAQQNGMAPADDSGKDGRQAVARNLPWNILDLRHFSAAKLKPLLALESEEWSRRLNWDYRTSTDLILHYLDSRVLPGYVAVEGGRVIGYVFCVYEEAKAVIGDVYATGSSGGRDTARDIERELLEHMITTLVHSPGTERIESQLLLHPSGRLSPVFRAAGFEVFPRDFMELRLEHRKGRAGAQPPAGLLMRSWTEEDYTPAAHLIANAYAGHLDSRINDQYQSIAGSLRFLHNIIRFPGCGRFDAAASRVLMNERTGKMEGVLLCSQVKEDVAHVTQVCVAPAAQGRGLGGLLIEECTRYLKRHGFSSVTLTVTQQNLGAVRLYDRLGFVQRHTFDAMLWLRPPMSLTEIMGQDDAD